jgi:hypothetical protein
MTSDSKKKEVAQLRQQLEASFNSQQLALHSKLSENQHALRQMESECSASKARIKELEASSAKLRVRKATEEERLNEEVRKLRISVKSLQEQLSQANSKCESLLSSGDAHLRQHHDEMSSLSAENAALREQLQKMMGMRSAPPAQFGAQMPPSAPHLSQSALQSHSREAASFVQATPSYSHRDNGASSSFAGALANDASRSPWTNSSFAAGHASSSALPLPMHTPSAAASAVATPLWSRGGGKSDHGFAMSFSSQIEATGGGGGQDETSELLKQQCVHRCVLLCPFARRSHAVLRYTALVQEANRIKQEYKTIRAQVSSSDVVIASLAERTRAALSPLLTFAVAAAVLSSIAHELNCWLVDVRKARALPAMTIALGEISEWRNKQQQRRRARKRVSILLVWELLQCSIYGHAAVGCCYCKLDCVDEETARTAQFLRGHGGEPGDAMNIAVVVVVVVVVNQRQGSLSLHSSCNFWRENTASRPSAEHSVLTIHEKSPCKKGSAQVPNAIEPDRQERLQILRYHHLDGHSGQVEVAAAASHEEYGLRCNSVRRWNLKGRNWVKGADAHL